MVWVVDGSGGTPRQDGTSSGNICPGRLPAGGGVPGGPWVGKAQGVVSPTLEQFQDSLGSPVSKTDFGLSRCGWRTTWSQAGLRESDRWAADWRSKGRVACCPGSSEIALWLSGSPPSLKWGGEGNACSSQHSQWAKPLLPGVRHGDNKCAL